MAKIRFEKIIPLFDAGEDFSLTETQYRNSTGKTLPKDYYYLKNKSALAKEAKKFGFQIEIQEKTVSFKKNEIKKKEKTK